MLLMTNSDNKDFDGKGGRQNNGNQHKQEEDREQGRMKLHTKLHRDTIEPKANFLGN